MNIYMLKKEIKYLLKNPIFYLGIIIVIEQNRCAMAYQGCGVVFF